MWSVCLSFCVSLPNLKRRGWQSWGEDKDKDRSRQGNKKSGRKNTISQKNGSSWFNEGGKNIAKKKKKAYLLQFTKNSKGEEDHVKYLRNRNELKEN